MKKRNCLWSTSPLLLLLWVGPAAFAPGAGGGEAAGSGEPGFLTGIFSERIRQVVQGWGELGLDTAVKPPDRPAAGLRIKDRDYAHGLGHHADGEIVVDLDGQFSVFAADLGVQWQGGQNVGSVVFQIFVDDRKVFDSGVMRENDAARPVTVALDGAEELRLVVTDAGDGITCDCADWAEARLVPNPKAASTAGRPRLDLAPFARVMTWKPAEQGGTKATRVEEFPANDLFPAAECLPVVGAYQAPDPGTDWSLGLQWAENRLLRRLELELPAGGEMPLPDSVQLQGWQGESAWQGKWQAIGGKPEATGTRWTWRLGFKELPGGTQKVRWVFSGPGRAAAVKTLSAFSRSRTGVLDLRLESTRTDLAGPAAITAYNGVILSSSSAAGNARAALGGGLRWSLNSTQPLLLKVLCNLPQRYKVDRTVLRFEFPGTAFSVAIEDLLSNDCVYVPHAGLFAAREPAPVTRAEYLQRIAGRTTVREQVRARPDQDFARAWEVVHLPVEDLEPTMLSLACDNRMFVVGRVGALAFDEFAGPGDTPWSYPGPWLATAQWRLVPRFGSTAKPVVTRRLRGGWLPAPEITVREGSVTYQQAAYVAPVEVAAATGHPAWWRERAACVVEYSARNEGSEAAAVRLALGLSPGREPKGAARFRAVPAGFEAVREGRLLVQFDARRGGPLALTPETDGLLWSGRLPARAEAKLMVLVPAWKVASGEPGPLLEEAGWPARFETYWREQLQSATQIETPDGFLDDVIRASQVHCAIAARNEQAGARIAPWIASISYGPLESEANSIIRGMGLLGHGEFARRSLDFFLSKRAPAGFITTGYTLVGTGEVLWTLGEEYERGRARDWLQKLAPDVAAVCQWVIRQRAKTKHLDARGEKVPEYGLMPPGVTADWGRFAYRFFNDAQYCAGLESAGRALADLGDPAAAGIIADAREYRADLERAYHWTQARMPIEPLANGTWVPADPSLLDCFGRVEDFLPGEDAGRTWCYSVEIGAHHLAATQVLDPASREVDWMLDYLEDVQFLRSGWPEYPEAANRHDVFDLGGFAKVQPYYCRVAEVYALRDEVKPFIRSYFNAIPSLLNRENLSFCEHFHNYGAWNKTHETGWFLCQTRDLFVLERGDELWLAPFLPGRWLAEGRRVAVRNAPTRFGPVSYTLRSAAAQGEIAAEVEFPVSSTARKVLLRLRHPEGRPIKTVTVQGQPHAGFVPEREVVALTPGEKMIAVRARY